jgi:hypothetical protein
VVPFAREWGCLGLFREERIESFHPRINLMERVLACIRQPEERLFKSVQMLELKDQNRQLGQVKPKGPRSPQEKAKRAANAMARRLELEQVVMAGQEEMQEEVHEMQVEMQE